MVVSAIVCLLFAISRTLFTQVMISHNENAAQKELITFRDAFLMFQTSDSIHSYPSDFNALGNYVNGFRAASNTTVERSGYAYTISNATPATYTITAAPLRSAISGNRTFVLDQGGSISIGRAGVSGNLANDWTRLSPTGVKASINHSEYDAQKGIFKLFWDYTNLLDKVLDNLIIVVDQIRFGGAAIGAKLVSDGLISKSDKSEEKANYYQVGRVEAGQKVSIAEELKWGGPVQGGWSYSRSLSAYEEKGK